MPRRNASNCLFQGTCSESTRNAFKNFITDLGSCAWCSLLIPAGLGPFLSVPYTTALTSVLQFPSSILCCSESIWAWLCLFLIASLFLGTLHTHSYLACFFPRPPPPPRTPSSSEALIVGGSSISHLPSPLLEFLTFSGTLTHKVWAYFYFLIHPQALLSLEHFL